jgi:hypothetical protein
LQSTPETVTAGIVKYQDYFKEEQISHPKLSPDILMRKTTPFEYERELRLIYHEEIKETEIYPIQLENGQVENMFKFKKLNNPGLNIRINIECLIKDIYVDPKAGQWFRDAVQGVIKTYYNLIYKIQSVPAVKPSILSYNSIQVDPVELDKLDSKFVLEVQQDIISNSSVGEKARQAQYRAHYDSESGEILGCYPTNFYYDVVPEPIIFLSWVEWQELINNQGTYIVDVDTKKVVKK